MTIRAVGSWNKVIKSLIALRKAWDEHSARMLEPFDLKNIPVKGQELLTLSLNRSRFQTVLPEFIRLAIGRGGLENLLIERDEGEEEENK